MKSFIFNRKRYGICYLSTCQLGWNWWTDRTFFIALVTILSLLPGTTQGRSTWPDHYNDKHQELHTKLQRTTHSHLEDFQVVIPSMTDHEYRHVTHNVRHKRSNRMRRDAIDDVVGSEENGLHYTVSGFGHEFKLHLELNHRLLSPTFSVKRIKRDAEEDLLDGSDAIGCHFHGRLVSPDGGETAMSTCNGLTGLLRTVEDDFLIEPVSSHVNHSFEAPLHPHIIYKKRQLDSGKHRLHYCGKRRAHPVAIPKTSKRQTINLLSNGEIELEDIEVPKSRSRRAVEYLKFGVGHNGDDVVDHVIKPRDRPRSKNIETLVVADRHMIENHERDHRDVTTYILTIMNMVSGLFSDRSLDGSVNMVLLGIILLEDDQELHLDHKADRSLANFCKWQHNHNHSNGKSPDHSILLTGIDICVHKNSPCETLGLAQIGGMCNTRHSCTINEDMGLGLAFTVAHETGHSFGMKHDGQGNVCSRRDGHIMSPTLNGLNGVFTWSACSREALRDFLNDEDSICLDDHPSSTATGLNFPDHLPGEIYDPVYQCQWQFGSTARLCDFRYEHKRTGLCKVLWCQRAGSHVCETKYMPAAEGTRCGDDMWCRRGVCVPHGSEGPLPVDGKWGEFGSWSGCTRTCGGGVQFRKRLCDNPPPKYGGYHCQGKEKTYQMCNIEKCPPSPSTFREDQCAKFNLKPYRRQYFNWVPFTKYSSFGRGRCELLCKADGYDFFDMLADRVVDGTPCDESTNDVCIEGKCEKVGCDFKLGSNATLDACGVCNGDNTTCETITGYYNEQVRDSGYYSVGRIPRGARNVRVWEEECCTHSYLAIKSATPPHTYHLNGNWQIDLFGSSVIAGARWSYKRETFQTEQLYTAGPLLEDIIVEILIVSRNPGVRFSYSLRKVDQYATGLLANTTLTRNQYNWSETFNECTQTCAGGVQTSVVVCLDDGAKEVHDEKCDLLSKPAATTQQCNQHSCPPRWVASSWSDCSTTCGDGEQERIFACKTFSIEGDIEVDVTQCAPLRKEEGKRKCKQKTCPPQWHIGEWSKCSRECGRGTRSRTIQCRGGGLVIRNKACDRSTKPKLRERCLVVYCKRIYQWFITAWEQCSTTCDSGVQKRTLRCSYKKRNGQYRSVAMRRCRHSRKPEVSLQKQCLNNPPCAGVKINPDIVVKSATGYTKDVGFTPNYRNAKWVAGTWQKCSASCGGGAQVRLVKCLHAGLSSSACSQRTKPLSKRSCNTYKCSLSASNEKPKSCEDNFSWCFLVPQHGQCSHSYFGTQCCKTCTSSAR